MKYVLKRIGTLLITGILLLTVSGCSMFDFFAAENLMKPPKLTGEKAKLQLAFEEAVGTDIRLFTPIAGDFRSSYIVFDADSDGNDEAVVFYSFNSNSSVVHMHLLSQMSGVWYSVGDFIGSGTEVYKVDFYNVDNSPNLEIGVIWCHDDSKKEKTLSLYRINTLDGNFEDSLVSLATIYIADYVYCDVDDDNSNELLYFYYENGKGDSSVNARLIDYDSLNENFVPISEVILPDIFTSVCQIVSDAEDNDLRFYVDCSVSGGNLFSEIIAYDKDAGALFIPQSDKKNISELSARDVDVYCTDFDKDGYYDIPIALDASESYVTSDSDESDIPLVFSEWYTYLDGSFRTLGKYFMNQFDGYALRLDALYSKYYIVYDYVNKITQVRLKDDDVETNLVFSVSCVNAVDDIVNILPEGLLGDKTDTEYKIVISAKGETLNFTEDYIRSLITDL